ncbi:death-on-curing protein [Helicobacter sp. 11S02629-2]|nr:type II toxin-antitoxin system death-on-curing family toxin [Helicobacter sp. 11S02629-2]PAF44194.1 death-on-curing protein [Helicobacter sp. 11S02629-2]
MRYLSLKEVLDLHDVVLDKQVGLKGYNPKQLAYLESALIHIQNDTYYPSLIDKLTHLMFSCIKFHPFNDGNKRTSLLLGMSFLRINGVDKPHLKPFALKMENVVIDVASGKINKVALNETIESILKT